MLSLLSAYVLPDQMWKGIRASFSIGARNRTGTQMPLGNVGLYAVLQLRSTIVTSHRPTDIAYHKVTCAASR
jgi:hypothetical protein